MKGISYQVDEQGRKKAVVLDLDEWGELWEEIEARLAKEAAQEGQRDKAPHHDLDHLIGTWSDQDVREFHEAIAPLEQVDEDLWRD